MERTFDRFVEKSPSARFNQYIDHVIKEFDVSIPRKEYFHIFNEMMKRNYEKVGYIGDADLVLDFMSKMCPIYLVTGNDMGHVKMIAQSPKILKSKFPFDRFTGIISGEMCERNKPHGDPYIVAMQEAGFLSHQTFVLEDSKNGVTSALNAGIPSSNIAVMHNEFENHQRPFLNSVTGMQFQNHTELLETLERSN